MALPIVEDEIIGAQAATVDAPQTAGVGFMPNTTAGFQTNVSPKFSNELARGGFDAGDTIGGKAAVPEMSFGDTAASVGKGFGVKAGGFFESRDAEKLKNYYGELEEWDATSKYWFDPYSGQVNMTIDDYLARMPSKQDALMSSTVTGGKMSDSKAGNVWGVAGSGVIGLDPLGAASFWSKVAGNKDRAKQFEYAYHKGGEGALGGLKTGGPVGAIVGGAVGYIQGILGWNDAKKADKAEATKAREDYEDQLKLWESAQRERAETLHKQYEAQRLSTAASRAKQALTTSKQKMVQGAVNKRALITGLVQGAQQRIPSRMKQRMV